VLKTINTGGLIIIPVRLCLTCLERNFETGFFTPLGLFLRTLSGRNWSNISKVNQFKKREVLVVVTAGILAEHDE
jgi:hypothetical protein